MGIHKTLRDFKPVYMTYAGGEYLLFRVQLSTATLRDRKHRANTTEPAPPARLRYRVHGNLNRNSYLDVGRTLAQDIRDLCKTSGRDFQSFTDILDFGSGCGRVIQNFRDPSESYKLHATDIDAELVSWGEDNLPGIQWSLNGHKPPLPFDDNAFDLIYGISVFTHLDEEFQRVWLRELQRIARPGATLILTVHGEYAAKQDIGMLDFSYRNELQNRGITFVKGTTGKLKLDGLPDFYQNAYHTKEYVYRDWSNYFDVIDFVERGINNHQDAVLLRKPV